MIIFENDIQSILEAEKDAPLRDVINFERIYTSEIEQVNLDYPEDIEKLKLAFIGNFQRINPVICEAIGFNPWEPRCLVLRFQC